MGPLATAHFFAMLCEAIPASADGDHPRVVIDSNPHIPSRSRHVIYGEASPVPGLIAGCQALARIPVDVIAIPCNSAAAFTAEIRPTVDVPVLDIRRASVERLARIAPTAKRIAVLGGRVTYALRSYAESAHEVGATVCDHGIELQSQIEALIARLKLGAPIASTEFARLLTDVVKQTRAEAAVLACTELALVPAPQIGVPVVDSSASLVAELVERWVAPSAA